MPSIQKPALQDLYNRLVAQPAHQKVDSSVLDRIVAIVGDSPSTSTAAVQQQLDSGLSREQKLALAQKGLDASEKADLHALLADGAFAARLDPVAANFLK